MHELDALFFQFLWDSKRSRVKKYVVCKHYEDGGINMPDVFTLLASRKIIWLQRKAEESSYSKFVKDIYPDLSTLGNYGGEYANILIILRIKITCGKMSQNTIRNYVLSVHH